MASNFMKIEITGNTTRAAEVRQAGSRFVLKVGVASNETWKDKSSGEEKKRTTFFTVEKWASEEKYLTGLANLLSMPGFGVFVSGKPSVNAYIGQDGEARGEIVINVSGTDAHFEIAKYPKGYEGNGGGSAHEESDIPF